MTAPAVPLSDELEAIKKQADKCASFHKKLKDRLSRAEKALADKHAIAPLLSQLVSDLRGMEPEPTPSLSQLIQSLEQHIKNHRRDIEDSFPANLRERCEAAQLPFAILPDGFGVGPFRVATNAAKEIALFHYAKVDMGVDAPLVTQRIVDQAISLKGSLIDQPVDLAKFADDLYEAMRVAAARQNKSAKSELRVELPLVFREMILIRQSSGSPSREKAKAEYSLPRFVVEFKQFVQSEQNTSSSHPYRPEPAVIENAKNPRKSIFIPQDLSRGYGEGTYYQAVVVRQD